MSQSRSGEQNRAGGQGGGGAGGSGGGASRAGGRAGEGTSDVAYNLTSVLYHALQGAETCGMYANDAEQDGNQELAGFFRETQQESLRRADRAKELLKREI